MADNNKKNDNTSNINFQLWIGVNILLVIVVVYGYMLLVNQGFKDDTNISYLILCIFSLFYILNIINTLYYNKEYQLIKESVLPRYDGESRKILYDGSPLFEKHIDNLSAIYNSLNDGDVDQTNSLDYLSNQLTRREEFVRLGSNVLITLGLIGTITGLIISITGLEEVMTSLGDDGTVVVGGLKQALSGMGTAFYTTLFGAILGGFFLKLMHQSSINIADEIIDDISLKSEVYILPHLKKTVENHINTQSSLLTTYMENSQKLLQDGTTNINNYIRSMDSLTSNIDSLNEKIKNMDKDIEEAPSTILKRIDKTLKKIREESKPIIKRFFG